ncbi:hypothetical protein GH714_006892 [Hevea brasiliensis]|uniref:Uncharacterized protein n=1 Tax=Hevea brasiliensis TaxID=3981 RepID=A0A6A6LD99_HEVBR|nr:hypothetical protein GH714_006892 [Hevea brasiliensis]
MSRKRKHFFILKLSKAYAILFGYRTMSSCFWDFSYCSKICFGHLIGLFKLALVVIDLHATIKLCEPALVAADSPQYIKLGSKQEDMALDKSWMGIENRKDPRYIHGVKVNDIYCGSNVNIGMDSNEASVGEEPKGDATTFYHLLREAKEKLHPECELSKLAAIVKLLHMKSFHRWTNRSFDDLLGLLRKLIPNGKQNLPQSYSSARKRFLPPSHKGRKDTKSFNGFRETRAIPKPLSGDEVLMELEAFTQMPLIELPQNDDGFDQNGCNDGLGIFRRSGRPLGRGEYHLLTDDWKQKTHLYILNNCEEVWPYVEKYKGSLPNISNRELMRRYNSEFPNWFFNHDDVCELVDDNEVYQEEENDMQGHPTRPIDNDDDIVDLNRVDVDPEEVMASVSKCKKNNRKMPPGLKSCISSAHDGWRQVSRSNTVCKLTSVNRIVRIQRQSSPTSIGKKRQLFRANFNHAPPTIIDAPSLSSPPLSIIEESRQSLITDIKNDPVDRNERQSLRAYINNESFGAINDRSQSSLPPTSATGVNNQSNRNPCQPEIETSGRSLMNFGGIDLDKLTNGKKDKLIIFISPGKYFRPIGEHERKLASWLGYCARSCGPPKEPWNAIEARYRTRLWSMIQMKMLYRKWKYKLHLKYLKYSSDDERLQHVPEGLTVDTWKEMFKVFANEDFQALCSTNTNNHASQRIIASTGPTPFAQVEYDMMDAEIGEVPYASEVWMATHGFLDEQGQTQWHDPESSRIYEEMQRIERNNQQMIMRLVLLQMIS